MSQVATKGQGSNALYFLAHKVGYWIFMLISAQRSPLEHFLPETIVRQVASYEFETHVKAGFGFWDGQEQNLVHQTNRLANLEKECFTSFKKMFD